MRASTVLPRANVLQEISDAVAGGATLITLRGPAGVGKTTIAGLWASAHGARVVQCEAAHDRSALVAELCRQLGWTWDADELPESAIPLVLDNLEQCASSAAEMVTGWQGRPLLLTTSRQALDVVGELVIDVPLLATDQAVQLYEMRSGLQDADGVPELVEWLDRRPLGIELAAAHAAVIGPRQLLEHLSNSLQLTSPSRSTVARHRSLIAAIDGSWSLLDQAERSVLAPLWTFGAEFTVEDAAAVIDLPIVQALAVLTGLSRKSLVHSRGDRGVVYMSLLGAVREYCSAKDADRVVTMHRHLAHLTAQCRADRTPLGGVDHSPLLRHWSDLRRILASDDVDADAAIEAVDAWRPFLRSHVPSADALQLIEGVLENTSEASLTSWGLVGIAVCNLWRRAGDPARAKDWGMRILARCADHPELTARTRSVLGSVMCWTNEPELASSELEAAAAYFSANGPSLEHVVTLRRLAGARYMLDQADASEIAMRAAEVAALDGEHGEQVLCLCHAGLYSRGPTAPAEALFAQALHVAHGPLRGVRLWLDLVHANRLQLHGRRGDPELAIESLRMLEAATEDERSRVLTLPAEGLGLLALLRSRDPDNQAEALRRMPAYLSRASESRVAAVLHMALAVHHWPEAVAEHHLNQAIRRSLVSDTEAAAVAMLALVHQHRGQRDEALRLLDSVPQTEQVDIARAVVQDPAAQIPADRDGDEHLQRLMLQFARSIGGRQTGSRIHVDKSGQWFRVGDQRVDLSNRRIPGRLLAYLAQARLDGRYCSVDELVEAGWPDQKMHLQSGRQRVWTNIRVLRKAGLDEHLQSTIDGYQLDPVVVEVVG